MTTHLPHGETTDAWMTFLDAETLAEKLPAPINNSVEASAEHQHLVQAARSFLVEAKQEMKNQPVVDHNQLNAKQRRMYDVTEQFLIAWC